MSWLHFNIKISKTKKTYHWILVRVRSYTRFGKPFKEPYTWRTPFLPALATISCQLVFSGMGLYDHLSIPCWNFVQLDLGQILFMFSQPVWVQYIQFYCCMQKIKFCWWVYTAVALTVFMTPLPLWCLSLERMMCDMDVPTRANYSIVSHPMYIDWL